MLIDTGFDGMIDDICHNIQNKIHRYQDQAQSRDPLHSSQFTHQSEYRSRKDQLRSEQSLDPGGIHQLFLRVHPLHGTIYHDDHEQYQIFEDFKGKIRKHTGHNAQCQTKIENPLQPELLLQPVKVFFILIAVLLEHMHVIPHGIKICRNRKHDRYQHTYDHFKYASIIPRNCAGFSRKEK